MLGFIKPVVTRLRGPAPLSEADVLYGAAYRVLYERCDPDGCVVPAHRDAVGAKLSAVGEWAASQPEHIAAAYRRAMLDIAKCADERLENNQRAMRMIEARKTLPVPPE